MSAVAHFFMSVAGSKIHERLAHFFIDIYTQQEPQVFNNQQERLTIRSQSLKWSDGEKTDGSKRV